MIWVDTREHKGKNTHILSAFYAVGADYEEHKLDEGDYMLEGGNITIDRKKDLEEISGNLCNKDRRFWREARRAHDKGLKLIVLIEEPDILSIKDVKEWKSKYSRVTGHNLADQMFRLHISHGVEFLFCDKVQAGRRIMELLGVV